MQSNKIKLKQVKAESFVSILANQALNQAWPWLDNSKRWDLSIVKLLCIFLWLACSNFSCN